MPQNLSQATGITSYIDGTRTVRSWPVESPGAAQRFITIHSLTLGALLAVSAAIMSYSAETLHATVRQLYPEREWLYYVNPFRDFHA